MLGVTENPRLGPADAALREIARDLGAEHTFRAVPVGAFFGRPGEEGREVADPYFGGAGPSRRGCTFCGACLVGCRHNAKNTLPKNYLYFAERAGAVISPDTTALDVRPLAGHQADGARYEVLCRRTGARIPRRPARLRARSVVCAAGTLGTLRLLLRWRTGGIALGSINEGLFDVPITAHILGGCPFGRSAEDGVVDVECRVHGYPGLYVVDGSIVPANPGVNPSLTITALAEYAMSRIPPAGHGRAA